MRRSRIALALAATATILVSGCGGDDNSSDTAGSAAGTTSADSGGAVSGYGSRPPATTAAPAAAGGLALTASESGGLSFDHKTLEATAGEVTLTLTNPEGDSLPHAIAIEGAGVDADGSTAQPGGTSAVTADLKAGTYTFYCPIGNHRQQGMEGTLTVS